MTNERKRTIFEDLRSSFNFSNKLQLIIRFNSFFKKLGFERVNYNKDFNGLYTYYPQITLMINPNFVMKNEVDSDDDEKYTYELISRTNNNYLQLYKMLSNKKGFLGLNTYKIIKRCNKEEIKPIKVTFENEEIIIGHYLKARNIVLLYFNPFYTDFNIENNEHLDFILNLIESRIKEIEFKKVDVSEKLKSAVIEKFKTEISNQLESIKLNVHSAEQDIGGLNSALIRQMGNLKLYKNQLNSLINFSSNTDITLKEQLEEVKKLPFVKNVKLTSRGITLDIGKININHKGKEVYIGDFYLMISPDNIKVFCRNPILSNDNMEVYHPHIDGDNNCYGSERSDKINEYLAGFELKKLVFFIYMFLKTYTPNDSYNSLEMWERENLRRKKLIDLDTEEDITNTSFLGDYFAEREDTGNRDLSDDDYDDENDEREVEYLGECIECGNSIYENDDYWVRDEDNDDIFCSEECKERFNRNREG